MINLGLHEYTWNSVELSDYIEKCHSLICSDVFQNLELVQLNHKEILGIVDKWCELDSDVFDKHNGGEIAGSSVGTSPSMMDTGANVSSNRQDNEDESANTSCLSARELQSSQE